MTMVVVAGALAAKPGNGGEAWVRPTWARGLRRLGFDVHLVEEVAALGDGGAGSAAVGFFPNLSLASRNEMRTRSSSRKLGSPA